ncbi:MAG: hypothetical protein ACUVXI_02050 [bacterium]
MHSRRMLWIMVLCCAIPLIAIFALPLFGVPLSTGLVVLLVLLCPVLHLIMMWGMHDQHGRASEHGGGHGGTDATEGSGGGDSPSPLE